MPELSIALLLLAAGLLAGVSNAIAGGGTFFTFPAFLAAGVPPIMANASNAIAVWPGHALAFVGYRSELSRYSKNMPGSVIVALAGGIVGALLVAYVGNKAFSKMIPFLILFATLLFGFGQGLSSWLSRRTDSADFSHPGFATRFLEFVFAVNGGFFGAGLGVMLMAGLLMLGVHDVQVNNALKNFLATIITSAAVVVFAVTGLVSWPHTLVAFVGAVAGGFLGSRIARFLPAVWLRRVVICVGLLFSVLYFGQYYL